MIVINNIQTRMVFRRAHTQHPTTPFNAIKPNLNSIKKQSWIRPFIRSFSETEDGGS